MYTNNFPLDDELLTGEAGGDLDAYCNSMVENGGAWDFEDMFAEPGEASDQSPEVSQASYFDVVSVSSEAQDLGAIQDIYWSTFNDFITADNLQGPSLAPSALERTPCKRLASQVDLDESPSKKACPMTPFSLITSPSTTFTSSPAANTPSPSPPLKKAAAMPRAKRTPKKPAKSKSSSPPPAPLAERSMAELYAAKFVTLTHEEKRRILLPLLHGKDPVTGMKLALPEPINAPATPPPASSPAFDMATYSFDTTPNDSPSSPSGLVLGPTASSGPDLSIFDSDDSMNAFSLRAITSFNANFGKTATEAAASVPFAFGPEVYAPAFAMAPASNPVAFDLVQYGDTAVENAASDPSAFDTTSFNDASAETTETDLFAIDLTNRDDASAETTTTDPSAIDTTSFNFASAMAAASDPFTFDLAQDDATAKTAKTDPFAFEFAQYDDPAANTTTSDQFLFDLTNFDDAFANTTTSDQFAFDPASYGFDAATIEGMGIARQREALEKHTYLKEQGRRR